MPATTGMQKDHSHNKDLEARMGIEPMIRALQAPPLPLGYRAKLILTPARRNPGASSPNTENLWSPGRKAVAQKQKPLDRFVVWRAVSSLDLGLERLDQ